MKPDDHSGTNSTPRAGTSQRADGGRDRGGGALVTGHAPQSIAVPTTSPPQCRSGEEGHTTWRWRRAQPEREVDAGRYDGRSAGREAAVADDAGREGRPADAVLLLPPAAGRPGSGARLRPRRTAPDGGVAAGAGRR